MTFANKNKKISTDIVENLGINMDFINKQAEFDFPQKWFQGKKKTTYDRFQEPQLEAGRESDL